LAITFNKKDLNAKEQPTPISVKQLHKVHCNQAAAYLTANPVSAELKSHKVMLQN
jgi:hypothetical protein